jgi:hypothetical protein
VYQTDSGLANDGLGDRRAPDADSAELGGGVGGGARHGYV